MNHKISKIYSPQVFKSQNSFHAQHHSRIESIDQSSMVLQDKLNLSYLNISQNTQQKQEDHQSPAKKRESFRRQKENKENQSPFKQAHFNERSQKIMVTPLNSPQKDNNDDDQIYEKPKPSNINVDNVAMTIEEFRSTLDEQPKCFNCQNIENIGDLVSICLCKKVHKQCMRQINDSLSLKINDEDLEKKLTCFNCKTLNHIKVKSKIDLKQCRNPKNLWFFIFIIILAFQSSALVVFISKNQERILSEPGIFIGILLIAIIIIGALSTLTVNKLLSMRQWSISIKKYKQDQQACLKNEFLIRIVKRFNQIGRL